MTQEDSSTKTSTTNANSNNDNNTAQQQEQSQQAQSSTETSSTPVPLNLFDYTEEELYCSNNARENAGNNNSSNGKSSKANNTSKIKFTHYELLQIPNHATPDQIKKAYRKLSLKYHPDKTGRDENDYVFLAIKNAYDTLMDPMKRQGYDSTVLHFDDSIPPSRATILLNATPATPYNEDVDFYTLYRPVFLRNLRFDARLRPDLPSSLSSSAALNSSTSNNSKNRNNNNNNNNKNTIPVPPDLGDNDTPLEEVHKFYDYWIHFSSWRDFTTQATQELQLQNEMENSESRYEKRYYIKEIEKRTKQLKRNEMTRIQTLVERAMEADPRLRKERQQIVLAKERIIEEKKQSIIRQQELQKQEEERMKQQLEQEKIQKQQEKIEREQQKKQHRKAKQSLRKMTSSSFQELLEQQKQQQEQQQNDATDSAATVDNGNNSIELLWEDSYDMNQDVEFLCSCLSLDELQQLNDDYEMGGLTLVHQHIIEHKNKQLQENSTTTATKISTTKTNAVIWTAKELSTLVKAMKKYPTGGAGRWDAICTMINHACAMPNPKTRQECIDKYNQLLKYNKTTTTTTNNNNNSNNIHNNSNATSNISETGQQNGHGTTNGDHGTGKTTTLSADIALDIPPTNSPDANTKGINLNASVNATTDSNTTSATTDVWTTEQDQLLQDALSKYPSTIEKNERWTLIAASIPGKNKKQCVQRFKTIREMLLVQQQSK